MRALDYQAEPLVERAQHKRREQQYADAYGEGAQQRVDVYRLRPRQRLPHPRRDVEQRTEAGKPLADFEYILAERHHLVVQTL